MVLVISYTSTYKETQIRKLQFNTGIIDTLKSSNPSYEFVDQFGNLYTYK